MLFASLGVERVRGALDVVAAAAAAAVRDPRAFVFGPVLAAACEEEEVSGAEHGWLVVGWCARWVGSDGWAGFVLCWFWCVVGERMVRRLECGCVDGIAGV